MRKKLSLRREQAIIRAKAKEKADAAKAVIGRFRPRKTERGTFVFVAPKKAAKGKRAGVERVPFNARRQAYAVYVTKTGKVRPVKEPKRNVERETRRRLQARGIEPGSKDYKTEFALTKMEVKAAAKIPPRRRPQNHDLVSQRQNRQAVKKLIGARLKPVLVRRVDATTAPVVTEMRAKPGSAVSLEAMAKVVERQMGKAFDVMGQVNKSLVIRFTVTVQTLDGEQRVIETSVPFNASFRQKLRELNVKKYVHNTVWKFVAQELAAQEWVSTGSAAYIERLAGNAGKSQRQWRKDGERWEKNEFQQVKVIAVDFQIDRVVV